MHSALLCTHTCGCSQTGEPPPAEASQTTPRKALSQHSSKELSSCCALEKSPALLQPISHPSQSFFFFPPSFPLF